MVNLVLRIVYGPKFVLRNIRNIVRALSIPLWTLVLLVIVDQVNLAPDERLDSGLLASPIEINRPKEVTVVRHGQGWHVQLLTALHVAIDPGAAIQQRIVCMTMQMDEWLFLNRRHRIEDFKKPRKGKVFSKFR